MTDEEIGSQLEHIFQQLDVPEENEETQKLKNEIVSMKKASKEILEPTIKNYMSHRVRAIAQFAKLSNKTKGFTDTRCGLWLDHKQKILPQRSRKVLGKRFSGPAISQCFLCPGTLLRTDPLQ